MFSIRHVGRLFPSSPMAKGLCVRLIVSDSCRSFAFLTDPQTREVAEREADQSHHQRPLLDLLRNRFGGATTRVNDVLRHPARLRPSLLCRFACVAQHFSCLTGCCHGSRGSILNYFLGWPAAAAVAAAALLTCSPIASPASVTRASMLVASFEDVLLITVLRTTSFWHANFYSAAPAGDQPVAYLNSGSILSPSLVPPGSMTLLSANFSRS